MRTVYLVGSAEAVFSKFFKLLENGLKRCVLLSYTHILGFSLGGQLLGPGCGGYYCSYKALPSSAIDGFLFYFWVIFARSAAFFINSWSDMHTGLHFLDGCCLAQHLHFGARHKPSHIDAQQYSTAISSVECFNKRRCGYQKMRHGRACAGGQ